VIDCIYLIVGFYITKVLAFYCEIRKDNYLSVFNTLAIFTE